MVQQELTPQIPILPKPFPPKRLWEAMEGVLANPQSGRTVANLAELAQLHNGNGGGAKTSTQRSVGANNRDP